MYETGIIMVLTLLTKQVISIKNLFFYISYAIEIYKVKMANELVLT